jgi:hypothetical protein
VNTESGYVVTSELSHVLREAFLGAAGPWTYFTDNRRGGGMLAVIEAITAEEASVPVGPKGTTIAGHVNHVRSSLAGSMILMSHSNASRDRSGNWAVSKVSESEWKRLQQDLRVQFESALKAIQAKMDWDEDALNAALGAITHAAYHLGAIRQRLLAAGLLRS